MRKKSQMPTDEKQQPKVQKKHSAAGMAMLAVIAVAGFSGYALQQNPELMDGVKSFFTVKAPADDPYQPQIDRLTQQISKLESGLETVAAQAAHPDLGEVYHKIDNIEQLSVNTVKSKADVESVLGLVMRMDRAEDKLDNLAKVNDQSALMLMSAMLVKDAGERGGSFVYEAEVLSQTAAGQPKIAAEVSRLNEIAADGIVTLLTLQHDFNKIYDARYQVADDGEQPAGSWKDRVYNELNKVVQIQKKDEVVAEVKEFSEEDRAWSVVRQLVDEGQISRALAIIDKPLNKTMADDESLSGWLEQARDYRDFYGSISRISANALAVMKVKFLQGEK